MFVQILEQVTAQTSKECQGSKYFDNYLDHAISIWCYKMTIPLDTTNYILRGYWQQETRNLTYYIYQEGIREKKDIKIHTPWGEQFTGFTINPLYQYIMALFNRMNITSGNVKFIVLIAFVVTAVGYFVYRLNQQRQEQTIPREEPRQYNPNPPSPTEQATPIQTITKQFLVLVVSASQADFLEHLKTKRYLNVSDGESLYDNTKYLWLGSETDFNKIKANINQYSILEGQESEYDIYLVYIELNQDNEGFKYNVNQLDRYDAFRNLDKLAVKFSISPRLQMEAYGNFDVYSR